VSPWRPRLRFNTRLAREMLGYGKHIVSSQTLIFLITNVDNAIVGRYAGQAALGYYQFAYNLSNLPATQITSIINQVMFPTFSKLSDENRAQTRVRYYLTTVRYVTWLTVPIAVATILFAPNFILGLYGETWAPAIVPLQMLAIYGLIRSIAANMGSIFRAMGKPQWLTFIAAGRLTVMLLALYPVTKIWGITGVSILSAAVAVIDFVVSAHLVNRLIDAPLIAYARLLAPTLMAALASGFVALRIYPHLPLAKTSYRLAACGVILVVAYLLLAMVFDRRLRETLRYYRRAVARNVAAWRAGRSAPRAA
jgi:PST family polysaccharide transporter/lipopolysaccharide exporter